MDNKRNYVPHNSKNTPSKPQPRITLPCSHCFFRAKDNREQKYVEKVGPTLRKETLMFFAQYDFHI